MGYIEAMRTRPTDVLTDSTEGGRGAEARELGMRSIVVYHTRQEHYNIKERNLQKYLIAFDIDDTLIILSFKQNRC